MLIGSNPLDSTNSTYSPDAIAAGNKAGIGAGLNLNPGSPSIPDQNNLIKANVPIPAATPTNPVITGDNTTQIKSVTVPTNPVQTTDTSLRATTDSYMTQPNGTSQNNDGSVYQTPPPDTVDPTIQSVRDTILGDTSQLATRGAKTNELNTQFGVDSKQQAYIDAYNAYQSKKVAYDQQVAAIYNQPGITREQAQAQAQEVSRVNNADLANLAVIATAAQGNFQGALDIVKRKIDAEFDPIQTEIDNLGKYVQINNADLTDNQKAQIQKQQYQLQNNLDQLKEAKLSAHQFALQQGITDSSILQKIDAAQTPADAFGAVGGTNQGVPQVTNTNGTTTGDIQTKINQYVDKSNQQYIDHSSDGVPYVDQGRLQNMTPYQRQQASSQYSAAGVRTLDPQDVSALTTIDEAKQNLSLFETTANSLLSSGLMGRIKGYTTNQLAQLAQTNPDWRQFQTLRAGLIKSVQGVAAGAPGLRVTGAELSNAAESLPNSFDNKESAQQAVDTFRKQLDINRNVLLRGSAPTGSTGNNPLGI